MLVVLDPGHDLDTPGKRSPDGSLREYEFNQVVADLAESILRANGVQVLLTKRLGDTFPSDEELQRRVAFANSKGADIYLSIHANAVGNGDWRDDAGGFEIYHHTDAVQGKKLAQMGHKHAWPRVSRMGIASNRGVKAADFYVLRETSMAACLYEFAFMTNHEETELLKRRDFRVECARAVAATALEWFGLDASAADQ